MLRNKESSDRDYPIVYAMSTWSFVTRNSRVIAASYPKHESVVWQRKTQVSAPKFDGLYSLVSNVCAGDGVPSIPPQCIIPVYPFLQFMPVYFLVFPTS